MGSPVPFEYRNGTFLPEVGLWLDPRRKSPLAFISHAHADHAGRHDRVIASPETLALMAARGVRQRDSIPMAYGEESELNGGRIELFPAGHVLGSAQIRITTDSGSLVYTGDFKLRPNRSCEIAEIRQADVLIMETTFGLARYRFPPLEETVGEIVAFPRESLEEGAVPVFLVYSLGKAQEVLSILGDAGFEVLVHESINRVTRVYREFDRPLPQCACLDEGRAEGKVVLFPPSARRPKAIAGSAPVRTAAVTGWGLDPSARYRYGCDAVFPLSDHADYDDLFRYVERVNPQVVYTLHGYAEEFARDLRTRGVEAWSLISENQMELPLDL